MDPRGDLGQIALRMAVSLLLCLALAALPGCLAGRDFTDPLVPFAHGPVPERSLVAPAPGDTVEVVTFNVRYGRRIGRALVELGGPRTADLDVLLLQEMTGKGVAAMADSLGLGYVYYPATIHPRHEREFGNAVLSRYPILSHGKVILPHPDPTGQRIAVRAELDLGDLRLLVYSVHLGVWISPEQRREQVGTILADLASQGGGAAVIGGDLNTLTRAHRRQVTWPLRRAGFREATRGVTSTFAVELLGITFLRATLDHIFVRGLAVAGAGLAGRDLDASDHRPVWAGLVLPPAAAAPRGSAPGPEVPWASSSRSRRPSPGPARSSSSSAPASRWPPTP